MEKDNVRMNVNITKVESPACFYGREVPGTDMSVESKRFQELEREMAADLNITRLKAPCYSIADVEGMIVAGQRVTEARHHGSRWYRVLVTTCMRRIQTSEAVCELLDYGEEVKIPLQLIRKLPEKYKKFPFQVKKFGLFGIQPITLVTNPEDMTSSYQLCTEWDNSAARYMEKILKDARYIQAEVIGVDRDDTYWINLHLKHPDGKCLNDMLVDNDYGKRTKTEKDYDFKPWEPMEERGHRTKARLPRVAFGFEERPARRTRSLSRSRSECGDDNASSASDYSEPMTRGGRYDTATHSDHEATERRGRTSLQTRSNQQKQTHHRKIKPLVPRQKSDEKKQPSLNGPTFPTRTTDMPECKAVKDPTQNVEKPAEGKPPERNSTCGEVLSSRTGNMPQISHLNKERVSQVENMISEKGSSLKSQQQEHVTEPKRPAMPVLGRGFFRTPLNLEPRVHGLQQRMSKETPNLNTKHDFIERPSSDTVTILSPSSPEIQNIGGDFSSTPKGRAAFRASPARPPQTDTCLGSVVDGKASRSPGRMTTAERIAASPKYTSNEKPCKESPASCTKLEKIEASANRESPDGHSGKGIPFKITANAHESTPQRSTASPGRGIMARLLTSPGFSNTKPSSLHLSDINKASPLAAAASPGQFEDAVKPVMAANAKTDSNTMTTQNTLPNQKTQQTAAKSHRPKPQQNAFAYGRHTIAGPQRPFFPYGHPMPFPPCGPQRPFLYQPNPQHYVPRWGAHPPLRYPGPPSPYIPVEASLGVVAMGDKKALEKRNDQLESYLNQVSDRPADEVPSKSLFKKSVNKAPEKPPKTAESKSLSVKGLPPANVTGATGMESMTTKKTASSTLKTSAVLNKTLPLGRGKLLQQKLGIKDSEPGTQKSILEDIFALMKTSPQNKSVSNENSSFPQIASGKIFTAAELEGGNNFKEPNNVKNTSENVTTTQPVVEDLQVTSSMGKLDFDTPVASGVESLPRHIKDVRTAASSITSSSSIFEAMDDSDTDTKFDSMSDNDQNVCCQSPQNSHQRPTSRLTTYLNNRADIPKFDNVPSSEDELIAVMAEASPVNPMYRSMYTPPPEQDTNMMPRRIEDVENLLSSVFSWSSDQEMQQLTPNVSDYQKTSYPDCVFKESQRVSEEGGTVCQSVLGRPVQGTESDKEVVTESCTDDVSRAISKDIIKEEQVKTPEQSISTETLKEPVVEPIQVSQTNKHAVVSPAKITVEISEEDSLISMISSVFVTMVAVASPTAARLFQSSSVDPDVEIETEVKAIPRAEVDHKEQDLESDEMPELESDQTEIKMTPILENMTAVDQVQDQSLEPEAISPTKEVPDSISLSELEPVEVELLKENPPELELGLPCEEVKDDTELSEPVSHSLERKAAMMEEKSNDKVESEEQHENSDTEMPELESEYPDLETTSIENVTAVDETQGQSIELRTASPSEESPDNTDLPELEPAVEVDLYERNHPELELGSPCKEASDEAISLTKEVPDSISLSEVEPVEVELLKENPPELELGLPCEEVKDDTELPEPVSHSLERKAAQMKEKSNDTVESEEQHEESDTEMPELESEYPDLETTSIENVTAVDETQGQSIELRTASPSEKIPDNTDLPELEPAVEVDLNERNPPELVLGLPCEEVKDDAELPEPVSHSLERKAAKMEEKSNDKVESEEQHGESDTEMPELESEYPDLETTSIENVTAVDETQGRTASPSEEIPDNTDLPELEPAVEVDLNERNHPELELGSPCKEASDDTELPEMEPVSSSPNQLNVEVQPVSGKASPNGQMHEDISVEIPKQEASENITQSQSKDKENDENDYDGIPELEHCDVADAINTTTGQVHSHGDLPQLEAQVSQWIETTELAPKLHQTSQFDDIIPVPGTESKAGDISNKDDFLQSDEDCPELEHVPVSRDLAKLSETRNVAADDALVAEDQNEASDSDIPELESSSAETKQEDKSRRPDEIPTDVSYAESPGFDKDEETLPEQDTNAIEQPEVSSNLDSSPSTLSKLPAGKPARKARLPKHVLEQQASSESRPVQQKERLNRMTALPSPASYSEEERSVRSSRIVTFSDSEDLLTKPRVCSPQTEPGKSILKKPTESVLLSKQLEAFHEEDENAMDDAVIKEILARARMQEQMRFQEVLEGGDSSRRSGYADFEYIDTSSETEDDTLERGVLRDGEYLDNCWPCIEDTFLHQDIKQVYLDEFVHTTSVLQSYVWPALVRGHSMVIVAPRCYSSGKHRLTKDMSSAYLPPMLSHYLYEGIPDGPGPLGLILCSSWKRVEWVFHQCSDFCAHIKIHPEALYGGCGEDALEVKLVNGFEVLVATPNSLCRMLDKQIFDLSRVMHLVLDDGDILTEEFTDSIQKIMSEYYLAVKNRESKQPSQLVLCGQQWTLGMADFMTKCIPQPQVVIQAKLEAAIYANTHFVVEMCPLLGQLKRLCSHILDPSVKVVFKTLVCCVDANTCATIAEGLESQCHYVLVVHEMSSRNDLEEARKAWHAAHSAEQGKPILVVTDGCLPEVGIDDAERVIHYDLPTKCPKLAFTERLWCMRTNFDKKRHEKNKENASEEAIRCESVMLLTDANGHLAPAVMELLQRVQAKVPKDLETLAKQALLKKEEFNSVPLCHYMCSFGRCTVGRLCKGRHQINGTLDSKTPAHQVKLPAKGYVTVKIMHVVDASCCWVRLVLHQDHDVDIHHNKEYVTMTTKLNILLADPNKRTPIVDPNKGDLIAVEDKQHTWNRGRITALGKHNKEGHIETVWVQLVDVGEVKKISVSEACQLPDDPCIITVPYQAFRVYICDVKPFDNDLQWTTRATLAVASRISGKEMMGRVVLSLGDTMWLVNLHEEEHLQVANMTVQTESITAYLVNNNMAVKNPQHLPLLYAACEGKVELPEVFNVSSTPGMGYERGQARTVSQVDRYGSSAIAAKKQRFTTSHGQLEKIAKSHFYTEKEINTCTKIVFPAFMNDLRENSHTIHRNGVVVFYTKDSVFSNLYINAPVTIDGKNYVCNEQYYAYQKALYFDDGVRANVILETCDAHRLVYLHKNVKNLDKAKWLPEAKRVLYRANLAKYTQNKHARQELLKTQDSKLGEASLSRVWGIGLSLGDARCMDPPQWRGQNLMGLILMKIRDLLKHDQEDAKYNLYQRPLNYTTVRLEDSPKVNKVLVPIVEAPDLFYVQFNTAEQILMELHFDIGDYMKLGDLEALSSASIKAGSLVLARLPASEADDEDVKWYRGKVTTVADTGFTVFYLDYGDICTVAADRVRPLPLRFLHPPCQAAECKLANVTFKGEDWDATSANDFVNLVWNSNDQALPLSATVLATEKSDTAGLVKHVVQLSYHGHGFPQDIAMEMVAMQHALLTDDYLDTLFSTASENETLRSFTQRCRQLLATRSEEERLKLLQDIKDTAEDVISLEGETICEVLSHMSHLLGYLPSSLDLLTNFVSNFDLIFPEEPSALAQESLTTIVLNLFRVLVRPTSTEQIKFQALASLVKLADFTSCRQYMTSECDGVKFISSILMGAEDGELALLAVKMLYSLLPPTLGYVKRVLESGAIEALCEHLKKTEEEEILTWCCMALQTAAAHNRWNGEIRKAKVGPKLCNALTNTLNQNTLEQVLQLLETLCETNRFTTEYLQECGLQTQLQELNKQERLNSVVRELAASVSTLTEMKEDDFTVDTGPLIPASLIKKTEMLDVSFKPAISGLRLLPTRIVDQIHTNLTRKYPTVKWAQDKFNIVLTVSVHDVGKQIPVTIYDNRVTFRAVVLDVEFYFDFSLYELVQPEKSCYDILNSEVRIGLRKVSKGNWPRLLKQKTLKPPYLEPDFAHSLTTDSEDSSDEDIEAKRNASPLDLLKRRRNRKRLPLPSDSPHKNRDGFENIIPSIPEFDYNPASTSDSNSDSGEQLSKERDEYNIFDVKDDQVSLARRY